NSRAACGQELSFLRAEVLAVCGNSGIAVNRHSLPSLPLASASVSPLPQQNIELLGVGKMRKSREPPIKLGFKCSERIGFQCNKRKIPRSVCRQREPPIT